MKFQYWDLVITGIVSFAVAWVGKKFDYKGIVRKAELEKSTAEVENKDEIYASWKDMYQTKAADHAELKEEYSKVRTTVLELEEQFSRLKIDMYELKRSMEEKEAGYILRIEQLTEQLEERDEEILHLSEQIIALKGGDVGD